MKNLLFLLISTFLLNQSYAAIYSSKEMDQPLKVLRQTSLGKKLIEEAEADGDIRVIYVKWPKHPFGALWNGDKRTVYINGSNSNNHFSSLVFELHNAKTNREMNHYFDLAETGMLSKEEFVKSIERMEHRNALETANIVKEAVDRKLLPQSVLMPPIQNFDDHYTVQQLFGHSQWIAKRYDEANPNGKFQHYRGSIDPNKFSEEDKNDLAFYLGARDSIRHNGINKSENLCILRHEYQIIKGCCSKKRLFDQVFKQDYSSAPMLYASAAPYHPPCSLQIPLTK